MSVIQTKSFQGHTMVKNGDLWVSRAPFTKIDWQSNIDRLRADHKRYGVLIETRVNGEVRHDLRFLSTLATLRDTFGHDGVPKDFGGSDVVYNVDDRVAAFEFFALEKIGNRLRHPMTHVTQFHAQGMCLVIGADLMTDEQYVKIVSGRSGNRKYATPNGELESPEGKEYVVSSRKIRRTETVDVEDLEFPTDPETGTRHYTGNVLKWMKRNPNEECQFGFRGASFNLNVASSYRFGNNAEFFYDYVGFLASAPA